jgi:hypothetical protein
MRDRRRELPVARSARRERVLPVLPGVTPLGGRASEMSVLKKQGFRDGIVRLDEAWTAAWRPRRRKPLQKDGFRPWAGVHPFDGGPPAPPLQRRPQSRRDRGERQD